MAGEITFNTRILDQAQNQDKLIDKLNKNDLKELQKFKDDKLAEFQAEVDSKFDNSKNWSIMINQEDNAIRNQVMRSVKFEQLKRRCLHDFMRQKKKEILDSKPKASIEEQTSNLIMVEDPPVDTEAYYQFKFTGIGDTWV